MIKFLLLLPLVLTPYWKDVSVYKVNREDYRTEFISFNSKEEALSKKFEESPYYYSLNGVWKFLYSDDYREIPEGVQNMDNVSSWDDITVPGNWERQGYGVAIYVNHPYEFQTKNPTPPLLPEKNPMGVYHRTFDLPSGWGDREILLNICGAKSGVYVYLNGEEIGYSTNSKDRAEFRLTGVQRDGKPLLKEKGNVLVFKIMRWSSGSWLECQDFWRISGIERDVYLSSEPKAFVKDFSVVSKLDKGLKDGYFALDLSLSNPSEKEITVGYELLDAQGSVVASESSKSSGAEICFSKTLPDVEKWSAESPYLYRLLISVSSDGKVEYIPFRVGFRRFEIVGSLFLVNGEPIKFKGVNIHEHNEVTGHYVTEELMRKDFEIMRKNNINAVRTAHYPQPRRFYELCDEIGIYVYTEANIESHGMGYNLNRGRSLGNNRDFWGLHLDRIEGMYKRTANYPSVAILSLGNEAGNGYNFYKAYEWIERLEKGENKMNRPICYERALWEWNSDMYVPQYPDAEWFQKIGESGSDRPIMPSEYSHSMGNSTGGIWRQWYYIYQYPHLQGAFIWDWVDQGLLEHDAEGRKYWTFGGDYGVNTPSDGNFCCNGLINPNRQPHPAIDEVKYAYSNFAVKEIDIQRGIFEVANRFYFTDLSKYELLYNILEEGKVIKKGSLNLTTPPQKSEQITIPLDKISMKEGYYYLINFSLVTKSEERYIPAKYSIAKEQFILKAPAKTINKIATKGAPLSLSEDPSKVTISSKSVSLLLNKVSGEVISLKYKGKEIFTDNFGIRPNFWRAPVDNDYGSNMPVRLAIWKNAPTVSEVTARMQDGNGVINVKYRLAPGNTLELVYTLYPSGELHTALNYSAAPEGTSEIPRLGVRFRLPKSNNMFTYFGRGPHENYVDRKAGSMMGLYALNTDISYFPYVRPQENGHRCDTKWLSFNGFRIIADDLLEFNVLHNSVEDFDRGKQSHINDIIPQNFVEVSLDFKHMGIGGFDSWGSRPEDYALVDAKGTYSWGFSIVP